jgi:hypothetical protein
MNIPLLQKFYRRSIPEKIEFIVGIVVIAYGLLLRLRFYSLNLTFWLDEAMLALNIVGRSFAGLVQQLDYNQGAPVGFLWLIKLAQVVLGNHEYSLRLMPFLAGCLTLFIAWLLARRVSGPVSAIFVILVLATSRYIVSYSVQVKQYAVDMAVTLALYLLALKFLRTTVKARDYWLLAILGAFSVWISHAAMFTLAGIGLVLVAISVLKKDRNAIMLYGLVGLFWVLNFVLLYLIQYRGLVGNTFLTDFWADYFMPLSISAPGWTLTMLVGLFYNPGGISNVVPAFFILLLFFLGLISFFRKREGWAWMFLLALFFTLVASGLQKYPFGGRMGMFALPGLLICAGEGIEMLRAFLLRKPMIGLGVAVVIVGLLSYSSMTYSIETLIKPKKVEHIAPTLAFLNANYRQGDLIYLYRESIPAYRYYASRYGLENARTIDGGDYHLDRPGYLSEINQLAGNKRVWFLFSHIAGPENIEDRDAILMYVGQLGEKKREFSDPGTTIELYLFDMAQ